MHTDVIVIGSGQAGVPLATRLAESGQKVLLLERGNLGGTCVNVGCTPTKTMIASARAAHVARQAGRLGVHTGDVRVDLAAVVERKNGIVRQWRQGVQHRLERSEAQWQQGQARFVGERTVQVGSETHRAERIIINTGARPAPPRLPGLDQVPFLDNASIMELQQLPEHLLILGGGYIACEFGQMFRRFGARVSIVHRGHHLLSREDPDVAQALEGVFRDEDIDLHLNAEGQSVAPTASGVRLELADGRSLQGSHLLVATGRVPNTDEIGCDAAGIETGQRGEIVVDDHYKTSADGIYAVGDVIGGPQFTHTSWDDHRLLFDTLMGRAARSRQDRLIPYAVFTDPPLARVGLSEKEAKQRGIAYELATLPYGRIARAIEVDETAGLMKLLVDGSSEKILGACLVGLEAGELIHIFVALMQAGSSARPLVEAQAVHPTVAEGVQSLVMSLKRYVLS